MIPVKRVRTAWIDYDGTTLSVRTNQTGIRPEASLLSTDIAIASILGQDKAFIGFTAATGASFGDHDIVSWQYRSRFIEDFDGEIPEPQTVGLISLSAFGFFLILRRRFKG